MIATCPSCTARYKINASKIKGRGAKITCPKCSRGFVVYREGEGPEIAKKKRVPKNVSSWDFRTLGLTWRVRSASGKAYDFFDLNTLRSFLDDGQVDSEDVITYDNRDWSRICEVSDLDAFFYEVWEKAKRGEISIAAPEDDYDEDEDDADDPTTIVDRGSELASELRRAVSSADTPASVSRTTLPHPKEHGKTPADILIEESTPAALGSSPALTKKDGAAQTNSSAHPSTRQGDDSNYPLLLLTSITVAIVAAILYSSLFAPNNRSATAPAHTPVPAAAPAPQAAPIPEAATEAPPASPKSAPETAPKTTPPAPI